MSQAMTFRLVDEDAAEVRRIAERERRSINEVGARIVGEWLRQVRHPMIEFRSFSGERLPCLKGGIRLWKLILTAQDFGMDVEKVAAHYENRYSLAQIQAVIDYYKEYAPEIDRDIDENRSAGFDALKRLLPQAERFPVSDQGLADAVGPEA
jgi:uncharacterized protein (DUF433 family)